jgi:hypothetical protein
MVTARAGLWRVALVGVLAVSACKKDSTAPDPGGGGSISISLSASSLSLEQGDDGTVTATVGRSGGFSGAVSVSVEGAPTGVTATASPPSVAAGSTASTISVSVGGSVAAGSYSLTVRASATDVSDATTTLALTVTEVSAGSFTLSIDPTSLTIQTGADGTASIDIARTDFSGAVALAVTGAPSGVSATVDPASTDGNTSTLTVTVGGSAAAGNYTLTVTGTASGLADQTATLALTVTVPTTGSGNTVWQFCPLSGLPTWFAYQDGSGPWTEVMPDVDNKYSFDILSGRGGVAYTMTPTGQVSTQIQFGTQQELNVQGSSICGTSGTGKTVNGTVANVAATDQAYVSLGGATASLTGATGTSFQLMNVPDGEVDLIASRSALTISGTSVSVEFNKGIIRRGLDPADGSTLAVLDFEAAEAFTPVDQNLTINNLGSDGAQVVESFFTPTGATGILYAETSLSTSATRTFKAVPGSVVESGDLNLLTVSAYDPAFTVPTTTRSAVTFFNAAADQTMTLGPAMGAVTVSTAAATPYVMPRIQYAVQTGYDRFFTWAASQVNGASGRTLTISASSGYLSGATDFDVTMPDFTGVGSFDAAWALFSGVEATWSFGASGWTTSGGDGTGLPYLDGAVSMSGTRLGMTVF